MNITNISNIPQMCGKIYIYKIEDCLYSFEKNQHTIAALESFGNGTDDCQFDGERELELTFNACKELDGELNLPWCLGIDI